jgi:LacI family transcriptional regulator
MPRETRTTLKQIAEELGISSSTVSRVLNGHAKRHRINSETEAAVRKLAEKRNFSPNQLARSLRLSKTNTIGLVVPDISNPFFASIARSVENEARHQGYSVVLCDTEDRTDLEIEVLGLLEGRKVEGLVLVPVGQECAHLKRYERNGLPVVVVDRWFRALKLPCVASDDYRGALEAVGLLLKSGHRCIACIQGLPGTAPNEERVRGYRDALRERGVKVDASLIVGDDFQEPNGYVQTQRLLRQRPDVTALWCLNNLISLGALRALSEAGRRVPEDVSVVSFDDPPYAPYLATPMTTVAQQHAEMGREAVRLLFERIASGKRVKPERVILPTKLVERKSVRCRSAL